MPIPDAYGPLIDKLMYDSRVFDDFSETDFRDLAMAAADQAGCSVINQDLILSALQGNLMDVIHDIFASRLGLGEWDLAKEELLSCISTNQE